MVDGSPLETRCEDIRDWAVYCRTSPICNILPPCGCISAAAAGVCDPSQGINTAALVELRPRHSNIFLPFFWMSFFCFSSTSISNFLLLGFRKYKMPYSLKCHAQALFCEQGTRTSWLSFLRLVRHSFSERFDVVGECAIRYGFPAIELVVVVVMVGSVSLVL